MVDARSRERFLGKVEEPRVGLKKGCIPGSKNTFVLIKKNSKNIQRASTSEKLSKIQSESAKVTSDKKKKPESKTEAKKDLPKKEDKGKK